MRTDDFRPSDNVEDDRAGERFARRLAGRRRRPRHRHHHHHRPDQLVLRHRSERAVQRRANSHRRRTRTQQQPVRRRRSPPARRPTPTGDFVALVLGDTEDRWTEIFAASGRTYHPPKLRLFSGSEPAAAAGAIGDGAVLLPARPAHLSRHLVLRRPAEQIRRLHRQQGLPVLGGLCDRPRGRPSRAGRARHPAAGDAAAAGGIEQGRGQRLQVRIELQADCLAGVWANRAQKKHSFLDAGDVDQALQTASAIGDDRLQKETQGYVVPDAFTHGTSEQRKRWFMNGFNSGEVSPAIRCRRARFSVCCRERSGSAFAGTSGSCVGVAMPGIDETKNFVPLKIAVLTVSDTRISRTTNPARCWCSGSSPPAILSPSAAS